MGGSFKVAQLWPGLTRAINRVPGVGDGVRRILLRESDDGKTGTDGYFTIRTRTMLTIMFRF